MQNINKEIASRQMIFDEAVRNKNWGVIIAEGEWFLKNAPSSGRKKDLALGYCNRGIIFGKGNKCSEAIADFTRCIEIGYGNPLIYNYRGTAYAEQKQYEEAIADFNKAIKIDENNAKAYRLRGITYRELGDYEQAINDYTKTINLDSNNSAAYNDRGNIYSEHRQYKLALNDFNEAIKVGHDCAVSYVGIGTTHARQGKFDEAIHAYKKAIELNSKHDLAYYNLGNAYVKKEKYDKAICAFNEVIKINPNHALTYICRGHAYLGKEDYEKAIDDYKKAISKDSDEEMGHYCFLYFTYYRPDQKEDKKKLLSQLGVVIKKFPHYPLFVHLKGNILYAINQNDDEAYKCFEKYLYLIKNNKSGFSYKNILEQIEVPSDFKENIQFAEVFCLQNEKYNPHERVLLTSTVLESMLRRLLFCVLHYDLEYDPETIKKSLEMSRFEVKNFTNIVKDISSKSNKASLTCLSDNLIEFWKDSDIVLLDSDRGFKSLQQYINQYDNFNVAIEIRNDIVHAKSMSFAPSNNFWDVVSGIDENQCYRALSIFLDFFIQLHEIFDEYFTSLTCVNTNFSLFAFSELKSIKANIHNEDETYDLLQKVGISKTLKTSKKKVLLF